MWLAYPGWLVFLVSLCTCCGYQKNSLNPCNTVENSRGDVNLTVLLFYSENKAEHFMWIVCPADDSRVTSRLIYKKKLLNMLSASRVKVGVHFIWQGRQKRTCWNVSTVLGSRPGRLMIGPGLGLPFQITVTWCLMSLSTKKNKKNI